MPDWLIQYGLHVPASPEAVSPFAFPSADQAGCLSIPFDSVVPACAMFVCCVNNLTLTR
ncbi:hypothetical protein [Streptomyces sp. NPDC052721]|uniref:hypothetical protein n=1 Tax=Streptomyces sp. NPDC052721 TaxID=3154955 RepID=UPI00341C37A9